VLLRHVYILYMTNPLNITIKTGIVAMSATVVSHYVFHIKYANTFMVYLFTEGQVTGSTASPKPPPPCFLYFTNKY